MQQPTIDVKHTHSENKRRRKNRNRRTAAPFLCIVTRFGRIKDGYFFLRVYSI